MCWGEQRWLLQIIKDSFVEAALGTPGELDSLQIFLKPTIKLLLWASWHCSAKKALSVQSSSACCSREHPGRPCPILARGPGTLCLSQRG